MLIKLKLPEKTNYEGEDELTLIRIGTKNQTIHEIESMNPPLEMDVKELAEIIHDLSISPTFQSLDRMTIGNAIDISKHLIANSHKWIKEKGK